MSRVAEQMENHPVHQVEDPESVARLSKEIISLEEQVLLYFGMPSVDGLTCSRVVRVCVFCGKLDAGSRARVFVNRDHADRKFSAQGGLGRCRRHS